MGGDALLRRALPRRGLLRPRRGQRRPRLPPRHRGRGGGRPRRLPARRRGRPRGGARRAPGRSRGADPPGPRRGQAAVRPRLGALQRGLALPALHGRQARALHPRARLLHRARSREPRSARRARRRDRRGARRRPLHAPRRPPARRRGRRLGDRRGAGPRARRDPAHAPDPPRRSERRALLHGDAAHEQPQHAAAVREAREGHRHRRQGLREGDRRGAAAVGLADARADAALGGDRPRGPATVDWRAMQSWDGSGFGLENLPYGAIARPGEAPQLAVRIGDDALLLAPLARRGALGALPPGTFDGPVLNPFLALGRAAWSATRAAITALLQDGAADDALTPLEGTTVHLPIAIGDYVDFYSSLEHATNLGRMFRPDAEPLLPNWRHLPVGYHGRAATVVPSGMPVRRPNGQRPGPKFGPSRRLDIELEAGFVIGAPSTMGEPVPVERALDHVFGMVLVNDWSARDIQAWEYQPLGPFLGKSFGTSISRWVVPVDELADRRVPGEPQEPTPLPYLAEQPWAYDIALEVELNGRVVSRTNARHLYWSVAQQIAHLTVNGAS